MFEHSFKKPLSLLILYNIEIKFKKMNVIDILVDMKWIYNDNFYTAHIPIIYLKWILMIIITIVKF